MKRKNSLFNILFAALFLTLSGCAEEDPQASPSLSRNSVTITVGGEPESVTISGGVSPYILTNSNSQVVDASNRSQNNTIVLTPKKQGSAIITVSGSDGGNTRLSVSVTG